MNRTLTEKISRRANLVMVNRNKKKKESKNTSSKQEKTIRKTIYDYFKKYNKEAVLKAILHLETKDYETLMMMCDNDLTKPINLNKWLKQSGCLGKIKDIHQLIIEDRNKEN